MSYSYPSNLPRATYPDFAAALDAEMKLLYADLLRDSLRPGLWWSPPKLGPLAPANLVRKYRLVDEGYVAPPSLRTRARRRWATVSERVGLARAALRGDDLHDGCGDW